MTKAQKIDQFNKEYNLKNVNLKWFKETSEDEQELKSLSVSGKTRNVWLDVVVRFFKNKWNILFLVILLALVLWIYIGSNVTHYSATKPVSTAVPDQIRYLPSSMSHGWNKASAEISQKFINNGWVPWDHSDVATSASALTSKNVLSHTINANDPLTVHVAYINQYAPKTILGTDSRGISVYARLLVSARWSLNLALIVASVESVIGIAIGIYVGFHVGKTIDTFAMRFVEIFQSVPGLLWMMIFAMVIGTSFWSMALVLILVGWVAPLYTARMYTLKIKDSEFILAAQAAGASKARRLYVHILPNIIGRLLVGFVHRIPAVIFIETTLVFLGMQVGGADHNSIGNLIADARVNEAITSNIAYALSISAFLLVFSISLQIIANGIRDAFDPKVSS